MEKAMSDAAHELAEWRALGRCSKGTLAGIIKSVEGAHGHGVPKGTLKPDTICKRVDRHIKDVVNEATTSPMLPVEPIILEFCIKMALIRQPLHRHTLAHLVP